MNPFTRNHDEPTVQERHGYGVVVLDLDGHSRELAHSVPLTPRQPVTASYSGVVDGLGRIQHPIGWLDGERPQLAPQVTRLVNTDAEIAAMVDELGTRQAVADLLGVKADSICRAVKRHQSGNGKAELIAARNERVIAHFQECGRVSWCAKKEKIDHHTVRTILRNAGFTNLKPYANR